MDPYYAGALSIVPPIIAVVLALITKEVFSSLILGILSGTFIYCCGRGGDANLIVGTVETAFKEMVVKFDLNIVLFCSLLGSLVYVISMAGGAKAYGQWATKRIKGRRSAMISTSVLGGFLFIDDYFNCLTVGTVMRPITDAFKISRAKLAYIIADRLHLFPHGRRLLVQILRKPTSLKVKPAHLLLQFPGISMRCSV